MIYFLSLFFLQITNKDLLFLLQDKKSLTRVKTVP